MGLCYHIIMCVHTYACPFKQPINWVKSGSGSVWRVDYSITATRKNQALP